MSKRICFFTKIDCAPPVDFRADLFGVGGFFKQVYFRTMWRLKRWDSGVVVGNSPAARAGESGRMVVWRLWLLFRLSFEEALGHAVGPVPVGIFLENLLDFSLNSLDRFERGLYDRFGWRSRKEEVPLAANTAASGRRVPSTPLRIGETRRNGFAKNDSGMLGAGALPGVGGAVSSRAREGAVRAPVHEAGAFQGRGVRYPPGLAGVHLSPSMSETWRWRASCSLRPQE